MLLQWDVTARMFKASVLFRRSSVCSANAFSVKLSEVLNIEQEHFFPKYSCYIYFVVVFNVSLCPAYPALCAHVATFSVLLFVFGKKGSFWVGRNFHNNYCYEWSWLSVKIELGVAFYWLLWPRECLEYHGNFWTVYVDLLEHTDSLLEAQIAVSRKPRRLRAEIPTLFTAAKSEIMLGLAENGLKCA